MNMLDSLKRAIEGKQKVVIQMQDTEEDKYILFHPYALLQDIAEGTTVFGLIERHYAHSEQNYFVRPTIKGLKTVQLETDLFKPSGEWKQIVKRISATIVISV